VIRRLVAGLIVVGLAIGVWFVWPRDDTGPTPTTLPAAVDSTPGATAVTTTLTTTTTTPGSTTSADSHVVTSVEEAEEILRALWFGWFEGIYNRDEERIKEVVATQSMLDAAREAFGAEFDSPPSPSAVVIDDLEILRSDSRCLATWSRVDISALRGEGSVTESVVILRRSEDAWKMATTWSFKEDLWQSDCESELEPLF
jgi:hypothetical protein